MCLGIPMKIIEIDGDFATVDAEGVKRRIGLQFLKDAKIEDYVIVHAGFAIARLDEKEAEETLNALRSLKDNYFEH